MKRFKSASHRKRFVSIHDPIANLFHFQRDSMTPPTIEPFALKP